MSARLKRAAEARCVKCGCTDSRACIGGCSWATVDEVAGLGICTACITPIKVSGTWRLGTDLPTKPTSALIAMSAEADGSMAFIHSTLHAFDLDKKEWRDEETDEPLGGGFFMWLDHDDVCPDDLFQRSAS